MQRAILLFAAAASGIVFSRELFDTFQMPKAFLIVMAAVGVALLAIARVILEGEVVIPRSPVIYTGGLFVAAFVLATVTSDAPAISVTGDYQRYTGLAMYASLAVLMVATARSFDGTSDGASVSRIHLALLGAVLLVAGYGLVQWAGADPFRWAGGFAQQIFATLGNPNFAAAYLGIGAPIVAYLAVRPSGSIRMRWVGGVLTVVVLTVASATDSVQGVVAGMAGLWVLGLAWVLTWPVAARRRGMVAIGALAAVGAAGLSLGLLNVGLAGRLVGGATLQIRRQYWAAAREMFFAQPVDGVGPGLYAGFFRRYRPLELVKSVDFRTVADAPHNVPLEMFAVGGVTLGIAYLAVLGATTWTIFVGLRRLEGERLLLLGAFAGGWVAYQAQSMVSIDVPPLASLHWFLTGAIVATVGFESRRISLPWQLAGASAQAPKGRKKAAQRRAAQRRVATQRYVSAGAAIAFVLLLWPLSRTIRAEAAHSNAISHRQADRHEEALLNSSQAVQRAPWMTDYWFELGNILIEMERHEDAAEAYRKALEADSNDVFAAMGVARVGRQTGDADLAVEYYERALEIEPKHPQLKIEVAEFLLSVEESGRALSLVREAIDVTPDDPRWWFVLGRVQGDLGNVVEARDAFERVIELSGGEQLAQDAREQLSALEG